jgi:hypothetical protein
MKKLGVASLIGMLVAILAVPSTASAESVDQITWLHKGSPVLWTAALGSAGGSPAWLQINLNTKNLLDRPKKFSGRCKVRSTYHWESNPDYTVTHWFRIRLGARKSEDYMYRVASPYQENVTGSDTRVVTCFYHTTRLHRRTP